MPKTLFVSILRQAEPATVEAEAESSPLAAEVLATWRTLVEPLPHNGEGDKEDFWEMAYRLHAGLNSGAKAVYLSIDNKPATIVNPTKKSWGKKSFDASEAYRLGSENPERYALYGPVSRFSPANAVRLPQEEMATQYASLAPYTAHSGRRIDLVSVGEGYEGEDVGVTIEERLLEYRDAGLTRAAIKSVRSKRFPLTVFDIAAGDNPVPSDLHDSIGDWAFQLLGLPEAFILQGYMNVQYEYRFFVVGGKPVTGAANIEEHTPLDAMPGVPFDPFMRQHRAAKSEVVEQVRRMVNYLDFATKVATEMADQHGLVDYVLDVATDGDTGEPFIVELNGLLNSGLFATDPREVTKALVA
jgi:hypothetical protein